MVGLRDGSAPRHAGDGGAAALDGDVAAPDGSAAIDARSQTPDVPDPDASMAPDPDDGVPPPDMGFRPPRDAAMVPVPDGCAAEVEVCNGLDDDCDGRVDEQLSAPLCENQRGLCMGATRVCGGGRGWDPCDERRFNQNNPGWTPVENALHCDGRDNDCDGEADEGCECRPDEVADCGVDVGECRMGLQRCEDGAFGPCSGRGPEPETCDGADEDCDGETDEGASCGRDEECRRGACVRTRWVYQSEGDEFGHSVGRRDGDGWSAGVDQDPPGYLAFGPYARDIPAGQYDVRFRLQVDVVNANNDNVVRIDVNDFDQRPDCGDCVLVSRTVRRREFAADRRYQDFTLRVQNPGGHRLEFRTWWTDRSYVKQDRVEVVPAP